MKICFFNLNAYSTFYPEGSAPIGGTEIQLFNVASYLSNFDNFDINFIVGDWGQKDFESYKKIKIHKSVLLKREMWNCIKLPFSIWRILKKINADVYIASSASLEIGLVAFFCKINKKKFIYRTAHDIDCNGEFIKRNGLIGKFFEYGLKNSSKVIVQTERNAKMIHNKYGINAEIVHNSYHITLKEYKKEKYILWVSRCQSWKNPDMFLDIVEKISDKNFIMICPRQKNELNLYDKIIKRASNLNNLRFIEKIAFDNIQKYYDEAFLFIGTSEYEGFPNTYLQACLGRTPIISYKVNPDEFITKNNLGYCCDGNFNLMSEEINKIFSDNSDWTKKSNNAFEYVKNSHNIEIEGKKWEWAILNTFKK